MRNLKSFICLSLVTRNAVVVSLFGILLTGGTPAVAGKLGKESSAFDAFTAKEWPQFQADKTPADCKVVSKKLNEKSYEGCFVDKTPMYIRMLDDGTPWGVLHFRKGLPVIYEGIEDSNLRLLRNGELYAVYNETEKTLRTNFSDSEGKELKNYTRTEVQSALKAFGLKAR